MSQIQIYPIACPQCHQQQNVELYDAVNIAEEPDLRDALVGNRLNVVTCSACSYKFAVDKPLLYHDPEQEIMIYWIPLNGQTVDQGEQYFRDFLNSLTRALPSEIPAPQVHLVFTRAELAERLFIMEAELDARIIEYMKYMVYTRNIGKMNPRQKLVLFDAHDSNDEQLAFLVQDIESRKIEGLLQYDRSAYDSLDEMFDDDEQTPDLFEFFPGPYISARELVLSELEREPQADAQAEHQADA